MSIDKEIKEDINIKEENLNVKEEKMPTKDIFTVWSDSIVGLSGIWEDSYVKLYRPWAEFTMEMSDKTKELSMNATPEQYKKFFKEWTDIYKANFGNLYPVPILEPDRETLKNFLDHGEDLNKLFSSWARETETNMRKTSEILQSEPDPVKYKECYDMWMKSHVKTFDEFLSIQSMGSMKQISENMGIPGNYPEAFAEMTKLWRNSFDRLYTPWIKAMQDISESAAKISSGTAGTEAYKEFYNLWIKTAQTTFERIFDPRSMQPSKEVFESFMESTNISLNLYKSWIEALEKISEKTRDISKISTSPETYTEFCRLWAKMNEKAFEDFFEDMPVAGPMKEMMEPIKTVSNMYANMFSRMVWKGFEAQKMP